MFSLKVINILNVGPVSYVSYQVLLVKLPFSIQSLVHDSRHFTDIENRINIQPRVTVYLALLDRM